MLTKPPIWWLIRLLATLTVDSLDADSATVTALSAFSAATSILSAAFEAFSAVAWALFVSYSPFLNPSDGNLRLARATSMRCGCELTDGRMALLGWGRKPPTLRGMLLEIRDVIGHSLFEGSEGEGKSLAAQATHLGLSEILIT